MARSTRTPEPEALDDLDACEVDMSVDPTPDADIEALVLFADVDLSDEAAVAARAAEWAEVLA